MMPSQIYLNSKINQDEEEHSKGGREGGGVKFNQVTLLINPLMPHITK